MSVEDRSYWQRRLADEEHRIVSARTIEAALIHQQLRDGYLAILRPDGRESSIPTAC